MKTRSLPLDARKNETPATRLFRVDRVPKPKGEASRFAGERLAEIVARGRSVDLEIGCGVGWHPIRYAHANPDRALIAIERTAEKFGKFHKRWVGSGEPANLIAVHADATAWVAHFAPVAAFERVFFLYPNPNSGNPHARWIRMPFFGHLLTKLRAGAEIEFRTNLPDYAAEIRREAATRWGLRIIEDARFTRAKVAPEMGGTHFERKYLERGETCFRIRLLLE